MEGVAYTAWKQSDWALLAVLLVGAAILRVAFVNGFGGSDDVVYLESALRVAAGNWTPATYNGALRYGFNLPAGMLFVLLGVNAWIANIWPLFCSLGEIVALYVLARLYAGQRAAIISAAILATIPLHIGVATRIHADPVVSFFLTLSFVLFYVAERRGARAVFLAAGLSMGMVFWVKELAVVTLLAFLSYPLAFRRWDRKWTFVVLGGMIMFALHLLLMQILAGDPLYVIKTVVGQVQRNYISADPTEHGAGFYLHYLFLEPKHTGLAPYIALCAGISVALRRNAFASQDLLQSYALWWLLALLAVLTLTPVSLSPLRLAVKQANYMTLFVAPISLLAGLWLARWRWGNWVAFIVIVGGVALGAAEQRAYRIFTANSRAAVAFAAAHPNDWILGTTNNANIAGVSSLLGEHINLEDRFGALKTEPAGRKAQLSQLMRQQPVGYTIFDMETLNWSNGPWLAPQQPPACWRAVQVLVPIDDDLSRVLLQGAIRLASTLSPRLGTEAGLALRAMLEPKVATVFQADARDLWCGGH